MNHNLKIKQEQKEREKKEKEEYKKQILKEKESEKRERRIQKIYDEIKHNASDEYIEKKIKPMLNLFAEKLFNETHILGVENLQNIQPDDQVIYLANHKSLADIILSMYVIMHTRNFSKSLGGNNLIVPYITKSPSILKLPDLKKSGMISIDRTKFDKDKRDIEYIRVFKEYMVNFLELHEDLLVYPEGGRTYSGDIGVLKSGLIKIMLPYASENTKIVPVTNNYDFVIEATGFENNSSTKFGGKNKIKRFLEDLYIFFKYIKQKKYKDNEAVFTFGEPINAKNQTHENIVTHIRNAFLDMTLVNTAGMVSYALKQNTNEVTQTQLIKTIEQLLYITPDQNLHPRLLRYNKDAEKILIHGKNTINQQKLSIRKHEYKYKVFDEFLINYYANGVKELYEKLNKN